MKLNGSRKHGKRLPRRELRRWRKRRRKAMRTQPVKIRGRGNARSFLMIVM